VKPKCDPGDTKRGCNTDGDSDAGVADFSSSHDPATR